MSRAMNVNLDEVAVLALCAERGAAVSASEDLPGGGTRVVLLNSGGAAAMRAAFGRKLIEGPVERTPFAPKSRS